MLTRIVQQVQRQRPDAMLRGLERLETLIVSRDLPHPRDIGQNDVARIVIPKATREFSHDYCPVPSALLTIASAAEKSKSPEPML